MVTMTIKTYRDWMGNLDEYLHIGDLVDMEMYYYFLDVLPPASMNGRIVQIGEPASHVNGRATYATLKKTEDGWMYVGECHRGETEEP
jgi:hypothetical protein